MNKGFISTISFLSALLLMTAWANSANSQSLQLRENWWHTNDEVTAMSYNATDNAVYLGGKFTHIGPVVPYGAIVDTLGQNNISIGKPNGKVKTAVPDGQGGWYIGGEFTAIGSTTRMHLAQIDASGNLTSWNPGANDDVNSILFFQSKIWIGGDFTQAGGQSRNRLADIDPVTGQAGTWNPGSNGVVHCMEANDQVLVIGGQFSNVGGQTRNNIASFDYVTAGAPLTTWNPNSNGIVWSLLAINTNLYAGGEFTNIGGQARNRIAAIALVSGAATTWNPNANGPVYALVQGPFDEVFVGGAFTTIGGQPRNRAASLSISAGTAYTWNPNANGPVKSISYFGAKVLLGGDFTTMGGTDRSFLATVESSNGLLESWQVPVGGAVGLISEQSGGDLFLGGDFHSLGGKNCKFLAAIDATTGQATDWSPTANNFVSTLTYANGVVYVGGFFTNLNGQTRNYIGALSTADGSVASWNPNANNTVTALLFDSGLLYTGGNFTDIGGQPRSFIAALDASTGLATTWNPNANNTVSAFALSGTTLYTGGSFTNIGGQNRNFIAALNTTTGIATSWNPSANFSVSALAVSGNTVYAGGAFSSIGSQPRNYLAALNTASGFATLWNPGPNQPLYALAHTPDLIFVGGDFTDFTSSLPRNRAAALEVTTGFTNNWNPNFPNRASSLLVLPDGILVGGMFTSALGSFTGSRHGLASFEWGCVEPDLPVLAADLDNVCPGTSVQLSVTGGSVNDAAYWQWYTESCDGTPAGVGIFNTVSPTQTTTYYARAEGGCPIPGACSEITVTVIPNSFNVIDTIVCVNYTAPDGALYTTTGNYLATLTNAAGCDSLITINLTVDPAQTTGNLTILTTAVGAPFSGMKVELVQSGAGSNYFQALNQGTSDVNGIMPFENIPAGNYFCRAVPDFSIAGQQNMMLTYSNEVFNWAQAELITLGCYETENEEIEVIQLETFSGPGSASGHVWFRTVQGDLPVEDGAEVRFFLQGDPIPGVPVILNKDTTASTIAPSGGYFPFALTLTIDDIQNNSSPYQFNNLPEGFYRVDVEIPGVPHAPDNYHFFQILIPTVTFEDLDFFVDSTNFVYITDNTNIEELIAGRGGLKAFPNPFSHQLNVMSTDEPLRSFHFMLLTLDGRLVRTGSRNEQDFIHVFSFADLPRGIYFLRIYSDEMDTTFKLIKE